MTFIFIWYTISAASQGSGLLGLLFYAMLFLLISPIWSFGIFLVFIFSCISFSLLVMYLIRVWKMSEDLKKWTDIYHLFILFSGILTLAFIIFAISTFAPETPEANINRVSIALGALYGFSILINLGFWLGIRSHLARLEREGKAHFTTGLFNKKTTTIQKV